MATIRVVFSAPDKNISEILNRLRGIEQIDPTSIAMSIWVDSTTLSVDDINNIVNDVDPPLPFKRIYRDINGRRVIDD